MLSKTLIAASVMAVALTACNKNEESAAPASTTPSTTAPATPSTTPPAGGTTTPGTSTAPSGGSTGTTQ